MVEKLLGVCAGNPLMEHGTVLLVEFEDFPSSFSGFDADFANALQKEREPAFPIPILADRRQRSGKPSASTKTS